MLVAALLAWRQSLAHKFVFNANEPVNQKDLLALRSRIANRRAELDNKIRASAVNLQQTSDFSLAQRVKLSGIANQTFVAQKQAEINEQIAAGPLHKASKFISICCAVLAAIGLIISGDTLNQRRPVNTLVITTEKPQQRTSRLEDPITTKKPLPQGIQNNSPVASAPAILNPQLERNRPAQDEGAKTTPLPLTPETPDSQPGSADAVTGPLLPRNLSNRDGATQVQQRLVELGFLSGLADGKWGLRSKRALLEYKEQAGLEKNDSWDAATERSLFSDGAAPAIKALSFIGGWGFKLGQCGEPGGAAPIRITAKRAETDGGVCEFNSVRPTATALGVLMRRAPREEIPTPHISD